MSELHSSQKKPVANNRLKNARLARGWTHKDVADMLNMTDSHIVSRWERGLHAPQPHYLKELSRIFGKSPEELGFAKSRLLEDEQGISHFEDEQSSLPFWNVPVSFTPLIGRDKDVKGVCDLLTRFEVRLVTLSGPGGVGKTRLSMQVASELRDRFRNGVCFVPLAAIRNAALVTPTIAEALAIQESGNLSVAEQIKAVLREKEILLLIDNFEQVVEASLFLEDLLASCPQLKILVTSRTVLHLSAEHEFEVLPLALPDIKNVSDAESLAQFASVELFVQRAQALSSAFLLTPKNLIAIAEVCSHLDGLPLAIELAAACSKILPPQALLAHLPERLQLLKSSLRTLPERHKTLYNTIAWSYELLDEQEQRVFRNLSVFAGGATLLAIRKICAAEENIVDTLGSLIDKSLLRQVETEGSEPRFVLLENIREFGLDCLTRNGELEESQRAYALYYLMLLESLEPELKGSHQTDWLAVLDRELDNLRTVLGWLLEKQETYLALRFCEVFGKYCGLRAYWTEERNWLKSALDLPWTSEQRAIRARVLRRAGHLAYRLRDLGQARALQEESVVLSRQVGDRQNLAGALSNLGWILYRQNEVVTAQLRLSECIQLARESGDQWSLANSLESLGRFMSFQRKTVEASELLQESLALARKLGDKESLTRILTTSGAFALSQGDFRQATQAADESFVLAQELGSRPLMALSLDNLGNIALFRGEYEKAALLFNEQIVRASELGDRSTVSIKRLQLADILLTQGHAEQALEFALESLALFQEQGDTPNQALALSFLGDIRQIQADFVQSLAYYFEALTLLHKDTNQKNIGRCLIGLAKIASRRTLLVLSARLYGAAEVFIQPQLDLHPVWRMDYKGAFEDVRARLDETVFQAALTYGKTVKLEEVLKSARASFAQSNS